ncbi:uncharacterized protein FOMMEDRAFT_96021 [Fomitiporia mediterranea MF3/22]|uniref:uncharacterized protein n=1 Tax=Fomitiporia mediterranea (strain MF3/22) TaxID=694068 RepID=UPI0004409124|nr:uncharacterized protein FOMMEDRAFT_96021 [Fomitiporia mediterranea MF3/22]EJC98543.1 hypothetical protein FOMMEDRAFT_96021 [Fomitiporia mediterranea MF3/22]
MYLAPVPDKLITTTELIITQACQLQKCLANLQAITECVHADQIASLQQFEETYKHLIKDFNFEPSQLVLIHNSKSQMDLGQKAKLYYLRPYIVVCHTQGGSYIVAELDGSVSCLHITVFCLVLYFAYTTLSILVTHLVENFGPANEINNTNNLLLSDKPSKDSDSD